MNKLVELMDKEFPFANESRLRRREAKLLFIDKSDPSRQQPEIGHYELKDIAELFDEGDVLVVNNSGTLPASFFAKHVRSRKPPFSSAFIVHDVPLGCVFWVIRVIL
ncbi:MAG: S-adenosylmethionine:tRNA ribosyltransferase-isomerase [Candidatus Heimdallarchaeota archaeon]|nr:S-adenosylmethionine:tRNA ribosyltransferase-isomerase [Candidatus Heimdallarchaeota archaeon]